jgi:hypothetical protein
MKTMFIIIDGSLDVHATATTLAIAKAFVAKAMAEYPGTTYFIHEVEFIG